LECIVNQLGQKTPRNRELPNTPSSGGLMNAAILLTSIDQLEVSKIGKTSRRWLRTLKEIFLMLKSKKLLTKVADLGN